MIALVFRESQFPLGVVFITPAAEVWLTLRDYSTSLARHSSTIAMTISAEKRLVDDAETRHSVFRAASGTVFWIVTDITRSVTAVLLPEEFHNRSCEAMSPTEVAALVS
jgi:hypothetical protein